MNTLWKSEQKEKAFKKSERNRVQKRDKKGKKKGGGMEIFHAEFKIRKHGFCIDMMQT